MRRTTSALLTVLALLLAAPLAAYTIYFKDGRTLQTKGKHRVVNGLAVVTLLNGTQASFNPQEIDVKRTDAMNKTDLGAAEIIDSGTRQAPGAPPAPRREQRISDLINKNGAGPRDVPPARREARREETATGAGVGVGRTRAGYPDFSQIARTPTPYAAADISAELRQFFLGQKAEAAEIFQGTQEGRPLVVVTTSSENSVFRALSVGANALLHVRDRFPGKVSDLELLMVTPSRERAGQFVLTPEMAEELVAKRVGLVSFFMENVQF